MMCDVTNAIIGAATITLVASLFTLKTRNMDKRRPNPINAAEDE